MPKYRQFTGIYLQQQNILFNKIVLSNNALILHFLQTNPCQHPIVILRDVTEADLQCILKFMYHGEVQIAEEHLKDFLKTAETLQVRGLVDGSATPVLADDTDTMASEEEKRLMLRRQRLMRRRTNNESNDDEAVDPTEVQNVSTYSYPWRTDYWTLF